MGTVERAEGRWREVLQILGIPARVLDGKHHPCPLPGCGGKDRFRFIDNGTGNYLCNQCGAGRGFRLLMNFHGWDFAKAAREIDQALGHVREKKPTPRFAISLDGVAEIWGRAKVVQNDDAVASYLSGRGIDGLAHWPVALRLADHWPHVVSKKYLPCMFALYQAPNGDMGTIHRTYLADVTPNRMFLPRPIPKGGAIRLFEPARTMGIAEGIETALSAAQLFGLPVWATLSERLLREWMPPAGARNIVVFGDNDQNYVGQAAAHHLAHRLVLRHGYKVSVLIPQNKGRDWNDVLRENALTEVLYAKEQLDNYLPQLRLHGGDRGQPSGEPISDSYL